MWIHRESITVLIATDSAFSGASKHGEPPLGRAMLCSWRQRRNPMAMRREDRNGSGPQAMWWNDMDPPSLRASGTVTTA